jgi:hypothetical protein
MAIRETRMMAAAVKNAWPVTPKHQQAIVTVLMQIALDANKYKPRERISAARAVMQAHLINVQLAQLDQNNQQHKDNLNNARLDRVALIATKLGHTGIVDAIAAERSSGNSSGNGASEGSADA